MGRNPLTQDDLKKRLLYDKNTGCFNDIETGKTVGWNQSGYLKTTICGKKYYLHRLVWLYVYGYFPDSEIDHKDGDRSNNKLSNLREASRIQNLWNTRVRKDNITGLKGVEYIKRLNKYRAVISVNGVRERLGTFRTAKEAEIAYKQRARVVQKEFAHSS